MSNEVDNMIAKNSDPQATEFNPTWEYWSHVAKETALTALKGAVIVGLMALTVSLIPAAPLGIVGTALNFVTGGMVAPTWGLGVMTAMGLQGALFGAFAGAAIGLVKGFSGAQDAVEEGQQADTSKKRLAQQFANNQRMIEMNMERQQEYLRGGYRPQPELPRGMDAGRGMGA